MQLAAGNQSVSEMKGLNGMSGRKQRRLKCNERRRSNSTNAEMISQRALARKKVKEKQRGKQREIRNDGGSPFS